MITRNFKPLGCPLDENGPESIHRAVELAQLFCTTNALPDAQQAKLAILVEEAVTNLYDHGGVSTGFCGHIDLYGATDDIRIVLSDSGTAFDLRTADDFEMPNMDRGGGVGLAMIRAWAQIIDYRSEAGINRLELKLRS
jgi:anti-sigma regulatory factor (Ser/Thr protein kinase)